LYSILKDHTSAIAYSKKACDEFKTAALEIENNLNSENVDIENDEIDANVEKKLSL